MLLSIPYPENPLSYSFKWLNQVAPTDVTDSKEVGEIDQLNVFIKLNFVTKLVIKTFSEKKQQAEEVLLG